MKVQRNRVIYITTFLGVAFVLDYFLSRFLNSIASYGQLNNPSWCSFYEKLEFFEFDGKYILFAVIYNLSNINAALIFAFFDSISLFLNGVLKLFYLDPRPFWEDQTLHPCFCAINYGKPSTTTITQFLIFSLSYKILTSKYPRYKLPIGILCSVPIFLISLSRFLQNAHSLSQLLLGIAVGYTIYYITFDILRIRLTRHRHIFLLLDNTLLVMVILGLAYCAATFVHYVLKFHYKQDWLDVLTAFCDYTPLYYFDNESYVKTTRIFLFMGSITGLYVEYRYRFSYNFNNFFVYNVKDISKYNMVFNNTSKTKHVLRILLMIAIYYTIIKNLGIFPLNPKTDPFFKTLVLRHIIPHFIEGVFTFFIIKLVFSICGLSNDTVFEVSKDDDATSIESLLNISTTLTPLPSEDKMKLNYLESEKQYNVMTR
jgi:membrane-associated phospholipid phosphatase